jgi:hypothetical protein
MNCGVFYDDEYSLLQDAKTEAPDERSMRLQASSVLQGGGQQAQHG